MLSLPVLSLFSFSTHLFPLSLISVPCLLSPRGSGCWLSAVGCRSQSAAEPSPCSRRSSKSYCHLQIHWSWGTNGTKENQIHETRYPSIDVVKQHTICPLFLIYNFSFCLRHIHFLSLCSAIFHELTLRALKIHLTSTLTAVCASYQSEYKSYLTHLFIF